MVEKTEKGKDSPLITIQLAFQGEYIPTHLTENEIVEETKGENA